MRRRHGTSPSGPRPDGILVHPCPVIRSLIAGSAALAGLRLVQAPDSRAAWLQVCAWRPMLLIIPAADLTIPPPIPGIEVRIVAMVRSDQSADVAVRARRAGAMDLVLEDEPTAQVAGAIAAVRDLVVGQRTAAVSERFARNEALPSREAWNDLLIEEALRRSGGLIAAAARLLGMTRQALHQRLIARCRQDTLTAHAVISPTADVPSPDSSKSYSKKPAASGIFD